MERFGSYSVRSLCDLLLYLFLRLFYQRLPLQPILELTALARLIIARSQGALMFAKVSVQATRNAGAGTM